MIVQTTQTVNLQQIHIIGLFKSTIIDNKYIVKAILSKIN